MWTANVVNHSNSKFNAFALFQHSEQQTQRNLALLQQLQTTLDVKNLIDIFAIEVAKYLDFTGIYFKHIDVNATARGSYQAKVQRHFELKINDQLFGVITYAVDMPISVSHYKVLTELHQLLINPLNNAVKYHQAMQFAMQDSLTQLGNRRSFDEQIKCTMAQANRRQTRVGLIFCDLNKFKAINDSFGHAMGDKVLVHFAKALHQSVRDSDSVFRFGGDEFAIIVTDATKPSLTVIEQRIYHAMSQDTFLTKYNVTSSLGLTFMNSTDDVTSFFQRADKALYSQKMNLPQKFSLAFKS
jgi:two-component system cell cycle response regulator